MSTPVFAFVSGKGGTAKTTSAFAMGFVLATNNVRVVFCDLDSTQALTDAAMTLRDPNVKVPLEVPMKITDDPPISLPTFGETGAVLLRAARALATSPMAVYDARVAQALAAAGPDGVVIVDCPGVLGKEIPAVSRVGAHFVVAVEPRATASKKATDLIAVLRQMYSDNPVSVLLTKVGKDKETQGTVAELTAQVGDLILDTIIPLDGWVPRAERDRIPVTAGRPSPAYHAYIAATDELLMRASNAMGAVA